MIFEAVASDWNLAYKKSDAYIVSSSFQNLCEPKQVANKVVYGGIYIELAKVLFQQWYRSIPVASMAPADTLELLSGRLLGVTYFRSRDHIRNIIISLQENECTAKTDHPLLPQCRAGLPQLMAFKPPWPSKKLERS